MSPIRFSYRISVKTATVEYFQKDFLSLTENRTQQVNYDVRHGQSQFGIRPRATAQGARRGRRGLRVPGRRGETVAAAAAVATADPSGRGPAEKTQRRAVRADGRHEKNRGKVHYVLRRSAEITGLQVNIYI